MSLTFEVFWRARNHCKEYSKLCQASFSGIVHCKLHEGTFMHPSRRSISTVSMFTDYLYKRDFGVVKRDINLAIPRCYRSLNLTRTILLDVFFLHAWEEIQNSSGNSCSDYLYLSQFQLDTSSPPLGNPLKNFFERVNPGHPGKFFCLIPCPVAKNVGRIPGGGAKFLKLEETAP